ncbi:hypothetical protein [Streptomyces sp. ICBB 8177]|uniref:imidazolonepropionase-like domain-containing protein n=1 Tax=Streptomyces sp. ICBB 8177 TaxID=563922 RepID=UPI000D682771|nr:hypothetical protein [Streptomyces sp. ICBB 8177]PWI45531.1 hypothetical protein CK485_05325 [Streptomyces sp. ICBB 8177]
MLTIHTAPLLRTRWESGPPVPEGAVVVSGDRIEAVGGLEELTARYPSARVRCWPGTLGPALVHEGPLPDAPSPRERVYAVMRTGAAAVVARHVTDPALRDAARRSGVRVVDEAVVPALAPGARADLTVLGDAGECLATVLAGRVLHRRR